MEGGAGNGRNQRVFTASAAHRGGACAGRSGCSQGAGDQGANQGSGTQDASSGNTSDSGGASSGRKQAQFTGPPWSDYLPVQNGRVCTYSASSRTENVMDMGLDVSVQVDENSKFTNVHEESDGTHFTINVNTETNATIEYEDGQTEDYPVEPINQNLKYVLTDNGTLKTVPQTGSLLGYEYNIDKFLVYPTVNKLKNGESVTESAVISVEASASEKQYLKPGEDKVETLTHTHQDNERRNLPE